MSEERSLLKRVRVAHEDGRLGGLAKSWLRAPGYLLFNPAATRVAVHAPPHVSPDPADGPLVERIFRSYRRMKEDQRGSPPVYLPADTWQRQLDVAYEYLNSGLRNNDVGRFHHFLANFGAWPHYTGVTWSTLIHGASRSVLKTRHLENEVFLRQSNLWRWFYGGRRPVEALDHPLHGNQSGAYVDGVFTTVSSYPAEVYGSVMAGLLAPSRRPVIAEVGAGYGVFPYYLLRGLDDYSYVDFDLPETLCLAAYFLSKSFPEKRVLLYGEAEYSVESHGEYDLVFMPGYSIERLADSSAELFLNTFSLGEMAPATAANYVHHIARIARYFLHMNHDRVPNVFGNAERGLLGYEYPMPLDRFRLLYRYPDLFHMTNWGFLNFASDTFTYLYERNAEAAAADGQ
jgi:hypothetical protein